MQESRFLMITLFIVMLVGAPAVYSVVSEPNLAMERYEGKGQGDRNPASVVEMILPSDGGSDTPKKQGITRSVTVDLDCVTESTEVSGTHLRVRGSSCVKDDAVKEVSIVNQSNGFTASVIFTRGNDYTTDFIDLADGENTLEISTVDGKGQKTTRSLIVKRLPASL